ncbi:hypothetical protein [Dyadobacter sp. CY356]|uniref:hypothetical protein n=1 Tax=Dyadobacter sp. CY356 TaxID=2906442 RepID=UPI001F2549B5|nr:hypothetical protein [Dyadobacter sp. CY356]MCF0056110.1 hypothetical protein [Dyadobacter sp. CY356]
MKKIYFLLLTAFISCSPDYDTKYYKAISLDKKDTAILKLITAKGSFYGDYKVIYDGRSTDEGTISGNIIGDTLVGNFRYLSRDNTKLIDPIVFLKTGNKLKLGTGEAGTYMNFHVYKRGTVSFADSLLQFLPVKPEEVSNSFKVIY